MAQHLSKRANNQWHPTLPVGLCTLSSEPAGKMQQFTATNQAMVPSGHSRGSSQMEMRISSQLASAQPQAPTSEGVLLELIVKLAITQFSAPVSWLGSGKLPVLSEKVPQLTHLISELPVTGKGKEQAGVDGHESRCDHQFNCLVDDYRG
jgi:hypothetical protein